MEREVALQASHSGKGNKQEPIKTLMNGDSNPLLAQCYAVLDAARPIVQMLMPKSVSVRGAPSMQEQRSKSVC